MTAETPTLQTARDVLRGPAVALAVAVIVLSLALGIGLVVFDRATLVPVVFAVVAAVVGVIGGIRGAIAISVAGFAVAAAAAHGVTLVPSLLLYGLTAVGCFGVIIGSEMSLSTRRNTTVDPGLATRVLVDHAEVLFFGVGLAAVAVAATSAITLPGWVVALPVLALVVGSVRGHREIQKRSATAPPAPRAQDRSAAQPPAPFR